MDLKRVLRESLAKVGTGLLYGIGFGISAGAIYYYVTEKMMDAIWNKDDAVSVVVKNHEKVNRGGAVVVLGTVENQGAQAIRMMNIEVDLFDKSGKFVDQCHDYVSGGLKAGETRNFKVTCGGKNKPVAAHETYKVRVGGMM